MISRLCNASSLLVFAVFLGSVPGAVAYGADESGKAGQALVIPLSPKENYNHQDMYYRCDYNAKKATSSQKRLAALLPKSLSFRVSYYNGDVTSLMTLPLDNRVLVLANVRAASGAKYVADSYSWWAEGDEAHFSYLSNDPDDEAGLTCHGSSKESANHEKKSEKH